MTAVSRSFIGVGMLFGVVATAGATGTASVPVDRLRITLERVPEEDSVGQRIAAFFREVRLRTVGPVLPKPGARFKVTATAYSSTVGQTDLTPCITAAGTRVRHGIVAANFLPLGTQLRIGDEMYVVEDRMNSRYNGKYIIDVWHPTRQQAKTFGAKILEIEVVGRTTLVPVKTARRASSQTSAPSEPAPPEPEPSPSDTPQSEEEPASSEAGPQDEPGPIRRMLRFLFGRAFTPEEEDCLTAPGG